MIFSVFLLFYLDDVRGTNLPVSEKQLVLMAKTKGEEVDLTTILSAMSETKTIKRKTAKALLNLTKQKYQD